MPKLKTGEKISWKEFGKRWGKGCKDVVAGMSPKQQIYQQMIGLRMILLGLVCGIVACAFNIKSLWWVEIIMVGGLYVNGVQYLGLWQKKKAFDELERQLNTLEIETLKPHHILDEMNIKHFGNEE